MANGEETSERGHERIELRQQAALAAREEEMPRVRAGAREIVMKTFIDPASEFVREASDYLWRLGDYERCDYLLTMCEELGVNADRHYSVHCLGGGRSVRIILTLIGSNPTERW